MKIAHVALWTSDLDRACRFYRETFGAEIGDPYRSSTTPGFMSRFARFSDGPAIELMYLPELAAPEVAASSPAARSEKRPRIGWAHLAISLGNEDAVRAMATQMASKGTLVSAPRWTGDGYFEAVIRDPDGNLIEVTI
ncbi:VOC family protein [Paraburkholderia sp. D15]|uniref:VOC family protein n=1 Tax=Paraburkholderia sp. D15 TaxID=2880218 RepID=UPI00247A2DB2|nr:VOC family protein [Paraburkholderia sp. D15]WGS53836.1 VOC family protein [Paraburkholderia sp. D15]